MSTTPATGKNLQVVEDYNTLCDLLETQAAHMKNIDRLKRLTKVEWVKFFECKKKITKFKGKLGLPINDPLTITKELAGEFNEL